METRTVWLPWLPPEKTSLLMIRRVTIVKNKGANVVTGEAEADDDLILYGYSLNFNFWVWFGQDDDLIVSSSSGGE